MESNQVSVNVAESGLTRYTIVSEDAVNLGASRFHLHVTSRSSQRIKFEFHFSDKADEGIRLSEQSVILEPGQENSTCVHFESEAFSSERALYLIAHFTATVWDQAFQKDEFEMKLWRSNPEAVQMLAAGSPGGTVREEVPGTGGP